MLFPSQNYWILVQTDINNVTAKKKEIKPGRPQVQATADSILGRAIARTNAVAETKKVKPEWQGYYDNLVQLRDQLLAQMCKARGLYNQRQLYS